MTLTTATLRRGLIAGALSAFVLTACEAEAVTLKVRIVPRQQREFSITVEGVTKMTVNQEATFEIEEGVKEIIIGDRKRITKAVLRPSLLSIHYVEQ